MAFSLRDVGAGTWGGARGFLQRRAPLPLPLPSSTILLRIVEPPDHKLAQDRLRARSPVSSRFSLLPPLLVDGPDKAASHSASAQRGRDSVPPSSRPPPLHSHAHQYCSSPNRSEDVPGTTNDVKGVVSAITSLGSTNAPRLHSLSPRVVRGGREARTTLAKWVGTAIVGGVLGGAIIS